MVDPMKTCSMNVCNLQNVDLSSEPIAGYLKLKYCQHTCAASDA